MVVFSQTNSVTPLFYSIYFSKIRLYMIFKLEEFFVVEYNEYSEYNEFVALLLQYCVHKSLKINVT